MPANSRRRALSLAALVTVVQTTAVLLASRAFAAPDPTPGSDPCDLIRGPAKAYCQSGDKAGSGAPKPPGGLTDDNPLDPLSSLAKGFAKAAAWIVTKLSDAVQSTSQVDFTNAAFLRQYAVVFAASTILTLVLWLLAVAKRAVRGVRLTEAIGEAVGFLWLTVLASAFTRSSCTPSCRRPTASPRSSRRRQGRRPTPSSAPSRRRSRRARTSAADRSC